MDDLTPHQRHLADLLQRQARALDVGDTAIAHVIRRGRHRRERRKVLVGVATVTTLSATVIGSIQLLSKPAQRRFITSTDSEPPEATLPGETVPATSAGLIPVTRVASNLQWNAVEPGTTEALGFNLWGPNGDTGEGPPYLAWSTGPGLSPDGVPVHVLYQSDDGIHWTPAGSNSFTEPEVSTRGTGSRAGRMFAFGTAAATAPIAPGGGGEVVVAVSDDQGTSWSNITLPVDLRTLAASDGVQSVGFQGDLAAGSAGVVALGVPTITFEPNVYSSGGVISRRDGAIRLTDPVCPSSGITATTVVVGYTGFTAPADSTPPDTTPAGTSPAVTWPAATTTIVGPGSDTVVPCTVDTSPQQNPIEPWADLGVDPAAVAATFAPRVFVTTDGQQFTEGSFPQLPDGYYLASLHVSATDSGYVASAQLYDPFGAGGAIAKLYTSTDGLAWSESELPAGQYDSVNALPDGTIVAFATGFNVPPAANAPFSPFMAVSSDGEQWSTMSLSSMLDATDGAGAVLQVSNASAGPTGLVAVGVIYQTAGTTPPKTILLHSTDGISWSRDDVDQIAGFDTFGASRVQVTDSNVLVSVIDTNHRDENQVPKTVVLVGTPKS